MTVGAVDPHLRDWESRPRARNKLQFPKPISRSAEKQDARKLKEAYLRVLHRLVKKRDQHRCRVCGSRQDVEVHHIRFRSVGGKDATQNLACLCKTHHAEVHAYRLAIQGDANGLLTMTRTGR